MGGRRLNIKKDKTGDEYFYELIAYLATSAKGCLDEPKSYGTFRLIDALSCLLLLPNYAPCLKKDPFLKKIQSEVDKNKFMHVSNPEAFKASLDDLILKLAKEAKKRRMKQ